MQTDGANYPCTVNHVVTITGIPVQFTVLTSVHPETPKRGRDKEMTAHPDVLDLARKA